MRQLAKVLGCSLTIACSLAAQVPGVTGTLVVTNKAPSAATIVDVASGRTLATLPTGPGPHEVVISTDGRVAVVTDYGEEARKTLTVIDVPGLRVTHTIDLGAYRTPHGIQFLVGDSLVAVTSEESGNVVIVHVASGMIRKAISTRANGSHMVGVVGDGSMAYTGNISSHNVSELDLRTGEFVRHFAVPKQPEAINVTPDGKEVWVGSNTTGKVSVIDRATGAVTTAAEGFGFPYRMLFSPDLRLVFIPDPRNNELRVLERASRRELGRLPFAGGSPQGIAISPDGRHVFQSLSQQARVAVVDVSSRAVIGHLAVGQTPDGVAYTTRVVSRS